MTDQVRRRGFLRPVPALRPPHIRKDSEPGSPPPPPHDDDGSPIPSQAQEVELSTAEFLVPASTDTDSGTRIGFRLTNGLHRQIQAILLSREFPYLTVGDFLRHATLRQCEWLESLRPGSITHTSYHLRIICEINDRQRANLELMETVDRLSSTVSALIGAGAECEAVAMLNGIMRQVRACPSDYWRKRLTKSLMDRFGHLIGKGISLKPDRS